MAVEWTNNFNDEQSADVIGGTVAGSHSLGASSLSAHSFNEADAAFGKNQVGGRANWAVGDEFTIAGTSTVYSITSLTLDDDSLGLGNATIGISPTLDENKDNGDAITKEDSYKGNHGSAENHLRLRNQGIV